MGVVLGNSGLETGRLSLGTVKFGRNTDVKYPTSFELPTDDEIRVLLGTCRKLGINLLDTAPAYGSSETRIGRLLPGERAEWILCSKVGEAYGDGHSHYDYSPSAVKQSVARSLTNLRTDYLDILLIHSDGNDLDIIEGTDIIDSLARIKEQGLARHIGMSTNTVAGTRAALAFSDILMVTLNLVDQSQLGVIQEARAQGCGLLLKKVLASGHHPPNESLSFVLNAAESASAVIGTINPEHLRANASFLMDA